VFTIDGKKSRALDDAISFNKVEDGVYRVGIHISDVASLIQSKTALDAEALKRAESTYVLNSFHLPMLPRELNSGVCSLNEDQARLAVTLWINLDDRGIADFSSASYE